ncbi:MAG: hypothetical protein M1818_004828 [Claussenomyces sp. TS43310]|nr:MAG: hypothetical protein M1818_004828 [Claussenomyces sp. TS43310]
MSAFDTKDMASALPPHLRPKVPIAPAANNLREYQAAQTRDVLSPHAVPFKQVQPASVPLSGPAGLQATQANPNMPPHAMLPHLPGRSQNVSSEARNALVAYAVDKGMSSTEAEGAANPDKSGAAETRDPQAAGWVVKQAYDYTSYNKTPKELSEEAASSGIVRPGWAANAAKYEWEDEYGDIGPVVPELEATLFGSEHHVRHGIDFARIAEIQVVQEGSIRPDPVRSFDDAGLHPCMLNNVKLAGYEIPTPVQAYCLPAILKGHDVVACAQTGSGKTAAFLIPTLSKLMGKAKKLAAPRPNPSTFRVGIDRPFRAEPLLLVVSPTRELAVQIFDEARRFCYRSMLRPCVIYGGGPQREQEEQLAKGCDVLIATPGRLCAMIDRPHIMSLQRLKYTIIDEADEMLNEDWRSEFTKIMSGGDQEEGNIIYMMFSATFPKTARDLATEYLAHDHVRIRVGRAGSSHGNIRQEISFVRPEGKHEALIKLIYSMPPARTIIFVNSRRSVDDLDDFLFNKAGLPVTSIHSDRTQLEREDAIRSFRTGRNPILVSSGVGARGLDVKNVMHVINYELPSQSYGGIEEYTHRIGRTGRIGNKGIATSFYNDRDEEMAGPLTKTLLETNQDVPDFLQQYIPEGYVPGEGNLKFEADSDFGDEDEVAQATGDAGDGWGADTATPEANNDGGWGASVPQTSGDDAGGGWGAPAQSGQSGGGVAAAW